LRGSLKVRDGGPSDPGDPDSPTGEGSKDKKDKKKKRRTVFKDIQDIKSTLAKFAKRPITVPQPRQPTQIIDTGARGMPIIMPSSGLSRPAGVATKQKPGIHITVKQIQNEKGKRRTKAAKKASKSTLTAARKRYTKLKKEVVKALRVAKKKQYDGANIKIKQLNPSQRKEARAKVQGSLKSKLNALLQQIKPGSRYKNVANVESAMSQIRRLKW
jgi:hypothetical protein